jgi:hypothetical protein
VVIVVGVTMQIIETYGEELRPNLRNENQRDVQMHLKYAILRMLCRWKGGHTLQLIGLVTSEPIRFATTWAIVATRQAM